MPQWLKEPLRQVADFMPDTPLPLPVRFKIIGKGGKVAEMECARMKPGEPDRSGRRKPVPIEGSNFKVQADTIIAAIGQKVDRNALRGLNTNQDRTVRINPGTGETSLKGVFAGGDLVRGP